MRVAIYSRYSSDLQNPKSIEDQVRLCREWLDRAGHSEAENFADAAISGSSAILRPQFQAMLAAIARKEFDAIVSEAMDRYSRNLSDTNDLYELCKFHGVKMMTVDVGEVGLLHVGMQGTMSALFLEGLAVKIKRGQRGAFERGQSPGGLAYGYKVGATTGSRVIDITQAGIIRRIFQDYNAGQSPRSISKVLNSEMAPSPQGGPWRASLIVGSRKRGNGILHNELYIGRMVFGRQRRAKNPATGKTIMQPVPRHEWRVKDMPELRILDDQTWRIAHDRINAAGGERLVFSRRPPRLLSGLLICADCGGPMTIKEHGRYVCRTAREEGTCNHGRSVLATEVEGRVVAALQTNLLDAELMDVFAREYRVAHAQIMAAKQAGKAGARADLAKAEKAIAGLMQAIEDGMYNPDMKARLDAATRMRDAAKRELEAPAAEPVTTLITGLKERFTGMVSSMSKFLDSNTHHAATAKAAVRSMVHAVYVFAENHDGRRRIEVEADFAPAFGGSGGVLLAITGMTIKVAA
jgi:DNA invertase Pin-like site-specific DNA recombinase